MSVSGASIFAAVAGTGKDEGVEFFNSSIFIKAGTDDYITKPFAVPDLHARVTRAFRRTYGVWARDKQMRARFYRV